MLKVSKLSNKIVWTSTLIWSVIFITISCSLIADLKISTHFNFEIWMELSKSILLWYIVALLCAFGVDVSQKKQNKM